ncbi:MAG: LysE family translocator [Anaerolineae bacterium]
MIDPSLLAFAGVAFGLTVAPGPNTLLVIRSSMLGGQRAGIWTAFGGCIALFCHALFSGFGLSVILVSSAVAFEVVKLIGASYLIYLGVKTLRRAWQHQPLDLLEVQAKVAPNRNARQSFMDGLISSLFTPETAIFYLAAVPQFIQPGESVMLKSFLLMSIHFSVRLLWYSLLSTFVSHIRALLTRKNVQKGIETLTGMLLIGFGIRLLTARR